MYASNAARDADIEETVEQPRPRRPGRGRDRRPSARLDRGVWACDGRPGHAVRPGCPAASPTFAAGHARAAAPGRGGDPPRRPRPRLPARRLAAGLLPRRGQAAAGRAGGAARGRPVDGARPPPTSTGCGSSATGQGPEIHGTAGDLAWWLVGRGGGRGLTCSAATCRCSAGGAEPRLGTTGWRDERDDLHRQGPAPAGARTSASSPKLMITKFSVGEMDNNVYLLRCRQTDDQLLVDAADDAAPDPAGRRRRRPAPRGHHPPALGPPPRAGRGGRGHRRRDGRGRRGRRRAAGRRWTAGSATATWSRSATAGSR